MNRIGIILGVFLSMVVSGFAACPVPVVITQMASNDTQSSGYIRAQVNPGGTNTFAFFRWDYNPALMGNVTTNLALGNGSTLTLATTGLTNLLAGTRIYFQPIASNVCGGVVTGALENFVTAQLSYSCNGPGLSDLDATRPYGSEPGSSWAPALRQTKCDVLAFAGVNFNIDGTFKAGAVNNAAVANGAITFNQLDPSLQAQITGGSSSAVVNVVLTNAMLLVSMIETAGAPVQTCCFSSGAQYLLATLNVVSNGYRYLMLEADVVGRNTTAGIRRFTFGIDLGYAPMDFGPYTAQADSTSGAASGWHISKIIAGKQLTTYQANVYGGSDNPSVNANMTCWVRTMRVWGIP